MAQGHSRDAVEFPGIVASWLSRWHGWIVVQEKAAKIELGGKGVSLVLAHSPGIPTSRFKKRRDFLGFTIFVIFPDFYFFVDWFYFF